MPTIDVNGLTRQERLRVWMARNNITVTGIAARLECSVAMASYLVNGKQSPRKRVEQLVEMGIPKGLLPSINEKSR